MAKIALQTADAPAAIGTYSQAIRAGNTVYISGQIPLEPTSMELVEGIEAQIHRVFRNVQAVAKSAGGDLDDMVKLTIYLTDLANFASVNEIMSQYFKQPYPARAAVEVSGLPRGAAVEIEGIMLTAD